MDWWYLSPPSSHFQFSGIRNEFHAANEKSQAMFIYTDAREMACMWLGEFSSCSWLTFLQVPAWVLLNWIYKPFPGSLYKFSMIFVRGASGLAKVSNFGSL